MMSRLKKLGIEKTRPEDLTEDEARRFSRFVCFLFFFFQNLRLFFSSVVSYLKKRVLVGEAFFFRNESCVPFPGTKK